MQEKISNIDLSQFEAMYDQFDKGHGLRHISRVRNLAVKLAKKYIPEKVELAYIAATLHDIGLINGREHHEVNGAQMVLESEDLRRVLSEEQINEVADAIREHRASTGDPSTILAKIISDADKVSDSPAEAMRRAVEYGMIHKANLNYEEQIIRAGTHLKKKFGEGGKGARLYFPESEEALKNNYGPIFDAVDRNDFAYLEGLYKNND